MDKNITITLPRKLNEKIEEETKKGKFKSKSDFLFFVLRGWDKAADNGLRIMPKKAKKIKEVRLTPDEKIAIDRAKDDIKHGRFSSHARIMEILNSKK